jgi:hypothetical protein
MRKRSPVPLRDLPVPVEPPSPDDAPGDWIEDLDEPGDMDCSHCGGDWYMQECDDPIQCCDPRCDGTWHPCTACQGTGLARHQVIW